MLEQMESIPLLLRLFTRVAIVTSVYFISNYFSIPNNFLKHLKQ